MTFDERLDAALKYFISIGAGAVTQRQIAERVGVSHQYICRIEKMAMKKLIATYR